MTVFADTYSTVTPAGSDSPTILDDRHRETKRAVQERENVDHYWPLTGTQVSDADAGEHRKLTVRTLSAGEVAALSASKAYFYRLVTDGEYYFTDGAGNTKKLSLSGNLAIAEADIAAILLDEDDMASDSATAPASQQSIKAYVDNNVSAFGAITTVDSDSNAMLKDHAYLAQQDGIVNAWVEDVGALSARLIGYNGGSDDPAGVGTKMVSVQNNSVQGSDGDYSITFPVAKGRYFEITYSGTGSPTIIWQPVGPESGAPVDQD